MSKWQIVVWGFIFLTLTRSALALPILNEIQIEPQESIELFNPTDSSIDLGGWILDDSGGTTFFTIPANTYLPPQSCLVFTGNFNLNRTSPDTARLFNPEQLLIDSYSYLLSPGIGMSWSRTIDQSSWIKQESTLGTDNNTQISCLPIVVTISATPTLAAITNTPTPLAMVISQIYLSEIFPYPLANKPEWVELYNDGDQTVALANWYIDDIENGGSNPKQLNLSIPARSRVVFELPQSILNNNQDTVRLLNSEQQEVDSFEYTHAVMDQSFSRRSTTGEWCLTNPSPNLENHSCTETDTDLDSITPSLTATITTELITPTTIVDISELKLGTGMHLLPTAKILGAQTKKQAPHNSLSKPLITWWLSINLVFNLGLFVSILMLYGQETAQSKSN